MDPLPLLDPAAVRVPDGDLRQACLVGARCAACGVTVFPAMPVCPGCGADEEMVEMEMGRTGRIYSYTIARFAPAGFTAPMYQAFVDILEGPRVFALIGEEVSVKDGVLADGMEMRLVVERLAATEENSGVLTYKYVPTAVRDGAEA